MVQLLLSVLVDPVVLVHQLVLVVLVVLVHLLILEDLADLVLQRDPVDLAHLFVP